MDAKIEIVKTEENEQKDAAALAVVKQNNSLLETPAVDKQDSAVKYTKERKSKLH